MKSKIILQNYDNSKPKNKSLYFFLSFLTFEENCCIAEVS